MSVLGSVLIKVWGLGVDIFKQYSEDASSQPAVRHMYAFRYPGLVLADQTAAPSTNSR